MIPPAESTEPASDDRRHIAGPSQCGAPTQSGAPCQRETGGGLCWQHEDATLADLPDAPAHLGEYGATLWREEVTECRERGILDEVSLPYLENMCEALDMRRSMWSDAQQGATIPGRDGTDKTNPAVSKHRKYLTEFRQCCKKWEKMKALASPSGDDDGFGDFM